MAFKFYIVDTLFGTVTGTNDEELAKSYAASDDNFVIDPSANVWLDTDGDTAQIDEAEALTEEEEEGDGLDFLWNCKRYLTG